jgi:four helix bundle protein
MRRSAVSIPSNIAEVQGRLTRGEFRQFLGIAKGSLAELETELIVSVKLNLLPRETTLFVKVEEVSKLLNGLLASI